MSGSILFVDDDATIVRQVERFFSIAGWETFTAGSGEEGVQVYEDHLPDVVVLDLQLPGASGLDVLDVLYHRGATVLLLTGHADVEVAVEAMRRGAENFLTKPIKLPHLAACVERAAEKAALRRVVAHHEQRRAAGHGAAGMGVSRRMQAISRQVALIAASGGTTVLLQGESGAGKGWLAHEIHRQSPRWRGPFVEINCAGLSSTFLESELFGHEKGAFTDAKAAKRGLFEVADGGTLFLDEIGDLAPELQPKLLKVLEDKTFRRMGGTREVHVDVRVVAATNHDLEAEVRTGRFRNDLFYRLHVLPLRVPALREREQEDLVALITDLFHDLLPHHPRGPRVLSSAAVDLLLCYDWPGNIRELRNALERALVLATGEREIRPEHLPPEVASIGPLGLPLATAEPALTLEEMERRHVERTLVRFSGNRSRAAEALGISRTTLHTKIKLFGLSEAGKDPVAEVRR